MVEKNRKKVFQARSNQGKNPALGDELSSVLQSAQVSMSRPFSYFFFLQQFLVKMNDQFCLKASQIPMRSSLVQEFKARRTMQWEEIVSELVFLISIFHEMNMKRPY